MLPSRQVSDIHRRHEQALLGNLAITRATTTLFFAAPALTGEAAIRMVT